MRNILPKMNTAPKSSRSKNSSIITFLLLLFLSTVDIVQLKGQNENQLLFQNFSETVDDYLFLSKTFLGISIDKSMEYSLNALKNAKESKEDSLIAKAYKSCGVSAFYSQQFTEAISYYDSANIYFERAGKMQDVANNFNNIGLAYSRMKDHLKAIDNLYIALEKNKQIRNTQNIGLISNNIGALYYELKAFKKASEYFEEAYELAKMNNNKPAMLTARNNMGMVENIFSNSDKALEIFKECVLIAIELKNYPELGSSYLNISNTFIRKSEADSAEYYLEEAMHYYQISDRPLDRVLLAMGRVNLLKGNKEEALKLFQQAMTKDRRSSDPELMLPILKEIYPLLEAKGNIAQAYATLKRYHLTFDTLKSLYDSTAAVSLEARFELENKLEEIALLQKETDELNQAMDKAVKQNTIFKTILYFSLLSIIILLIITVHYFRLFNRSRKSLQLLAEENNLNRQASITLTESLNILTQKEEILSAIINSSPDIICYKDGNGRWLKANKAQLELFGLAESDYELKTDKTLASNNSEYTELFKAIILSDELCWQKGTSTREDFEIIDNNGSKKIFDQVKVPLFKPDGSRKGLAMIGRDITELKKIEEKLKSGFLKAQRDEHLKTTLFANLSHEIRTSLNAIIGFGDLLLESKNNDLANNLKFIKSIQENGRLLNSLISNITDFSNNENGNTGINLGPVNFNKLFRNVNEHFKNLTVLVNKKHLNILLSIPKEQIVLKADEQRIRQILLNLFDNALKHTEAGFIETGFEMKTNENGENIVRIYIRDSGEGISEALLNQLNNQFHKNEYNFDRTKPGSGLGLDIINNLVKMMDGNLYIISQQGEGTEVSIALPAVPDVLAENPQKIDDLKKINLSGKEILIVEDTYSNFEVLKIMLETIGAKVSYASNGKEAIEIFSKHPNFDLVLMDIQMPVMNGLKTTIQIKKINPNIPVIAQTALAMANEREACYVAGCDEYIAKPIKLRALIPLLKKVLGKEG